MVNVNAYDKKSGTYDASVKNFLGMLKKSFKKRRDLFTLSRARKVTGGHPSQIRKWIPELVEQHKLRKVDAYFLGCSLTKPIVLSFDFGQVAICPTCNSELLWPPEDDEFVCDCGVEYIEDENGTWRHEPRIKFLAGGVFSVESFTTPGTFYTVDVTRRSCTCSHHLFRGAYCKHMKRVGLILTALLFEEVRSKNDSKSVSSQEFAVINAVLRRCFDPREYFGTASYMEVRNDVKKLYGLELTENQIGRTVSSVERDGMLERIQDPRSGMGSKTLITPNQRRLRQILDEVRERAIDGRWCREVTSHLPAGKEPFLAIDRVAHSNLALPHMPFTVGVQINYRVPKAIDVLVVVRLEGSQKVLGVSQTRLEGEDLLRCDLEINLPQEPAWRLRVELYREREGQWCPVDRYTSRQRIHAPTIKLERPKLWIVQSFSGKEKHYMVDTLIKSCSCPDYTYNRNHYCKHLQAVERIEKSLGIEYGTYTTKPEANPVLLRHQ